MEYNLNAPDPCLLAILLVISTHSGPQFVCQYPPIVNDDDLRSFTDQKLRESELLSDSTSDGYSESALEDEFSDEEGSDQEQVNNTTETLIERLERHKVVKKKKQVEQKKHKDHKRSSDEFAINESADFGSTAASRLIDARRDSAMNSVAGNSSTANGASHSESLKKVLGFDADFLGELLCPTRAMCNTKFEMTVDDMVFLGLPIHILEEGVWRKKKSKTYLDPSQHSTDVDSRRKLSLASSKDSKKTRRGKQTTEEDVYPEDGGDEREEMEVNDEEADEDQETAPTDEKPNTDTCSMRMFNVVFVMNPPITEFNQKIESMYQSVLTQFVRCLRTEQAKSNYVWEQASTMLQLREVAEQEKYSITRLWEEKERKSTLALAISQLFNAIKASNIANVLLNSKLRSFQIPLATEFARLPDITDDQHITGSYLISSEEMYDENPQGMFSEYYAILLLDEPENIIRDIHADPYSPLAAFIREISPTQTIKMLSDASGLTVEQITEMTRSLIHWRRARKIFPIGARNTYIVSPLAPIAELYKFVGWFSKRFPSMPSLSRILSMLSTGKPRPFSSHIPSRDHRDVYLNALAWLLRNGFVTQLRTFLWIKISPKIKIAVKRDMELEEEMKLANLEDEKDKEQTKNTDTSTDNTSKQARANKAATGKSPTKGKANVTFLLEGLKTTGSLSENAIDDDGDAGYDLSSRGSFVNDNNGLEDDTILIEPERATLIQRRWMAKIIEERPNDIKVLFNKLVKYFNGRYTAERAMILENVSRQEMRKLTSVLEDHIVVVRHW